MFLQVLLLLFVCLDNYDLKVSALPDIRLDEFLPEIPPTSAPQPLIPFLAPSPLVPFINNTTPKLSGLCELNFTTSESLIRTTSTNCWSAFAPLLANVMCCPQLEATLMIQMGQSSKHTGLLALNASHAKHCLSDIEEILASQGASDELTDVCSVHPSNLTAGSCPIKDVKEFETIVDSSKLISACEKIDPVKECCEQACEKAIMEVATKIALQASDSLSMDGSHASENSVRVNDCRSIVLRWLSSQLDPSHAKQILRGLTSCNINSVCPLVFPHMRHLASSCMDVISNKTGCCKAMESYVSHLQKQSLITNLQAVDCASSLGAKLQKLNITRDVYSMCHLSLKDFSLQVGNQVSGCLLPSLPSDALFDKVAGISFTCDLNDNIPAPWPSLSQLPRLSCNKTVKIPALPAAASAQNGLYDPRTKHHVFLASSVVLMMLL